MVVFALLALLPVSITALYVGMLAAMVAFRFIAAAYQGLLALLGQERQMSGQLTVLWQTVQYIATLGAGFAGGWSAQLLSPSGTFAAIALVILPMAFFGWWKPDGVFRRTYDAPEAQGSDFTAT